MDGGRVKAVEGAALKGAQFRYFDLVMAAFVAILFGRCTAAATGPRRASRRVRTTIDHTMPDDPATPPIGRIRAVRKRLTSRASSLAGGVAEAAGEVASGVVPVAGAVVGKAEDLVEEIPTVARQLAASTRQAAETRVRVLLVRRPGARAGESVRIFAIRTGAWCETTVLDRIEDVDGLDLGALADAACAIPHEQLLRIWRGTDPERSGQIVFVPQEPNFVGTNFPHSGPWNYLQDVPLFWYGPGIIPSTIAPRPAPIPG